jgi:hypothetical protein
MKNANAFAILILFIIFCISLGLVFWTPQPLEKNAAGNPATSGFIPSEKITEHYKTSSRDVTINATVRQFPSSVPLYRATIRGDDAFYKLLGDTFHTKQSVTSAEEAPEVAEKVMVQYGGLPSDAVFVWSDTEYSYKQSNNGTILSKKPVMTSAVYGRRVNGLSFDGDTDYIRVELGENGQPLEIRKLWRNLTPLGNVSIIPASAVVEQLKYNDTMDKDWAIIGMEWGGLNITIDTIVLRYFEIEGSDTYVEPVWVCNGDVIYGIDSWKEYISFALNARHFASFASDKSSVSAGEPVTFSDTSQTNAIQWFWEFGDGTNSIRQNPTHVYLEKGTFTANLTVWNRFGKDRISKEGYIIVSSGQIDNNPSSGVETTRSSDIRKEP